LRYPPALTPNVGRVETQIARIIHRQTPASASAGSEGRTSMIPTDLVSLSGFLRASRGRSQEEIISEFLAAVRDPNDPDSLIEDASVLIDHAREQKLMVFNDKFLDPTKRWETAIGYNEGVAGRCFRERDTTEYPSRRGKKVVMELVGKGDIKNMVCIPIKFRSDSDTPFGVACFHNNDANKKFSEDDIRTLDSYVDLLALALHLPHPEIQLDNNVFIVHGRDTSSVDGLELILRRYGVTPMILRQEKRSAQLILDSLERILRICNSGFIVVTPDDEGRLDESEEAFQPRARENVIFETGLLFAKFRQSQRVSILLKKPAKLPSDLTGMFVDQFETINSVEHKISERLRDWGMIK
jgi:predicted nucleotide-binding protein